MCPPPPHTLVSDSKNSGTSYLFDDFGFYIGKEKNKGDNNLVIVNTDTRERKLYEFNDPFTDVSAIEYNIKKFGEDNFKDVKFIFNVSTLEINEMMNESDIEERGFLARAFFTLTQSDSGKMDFAVYHLSIIIAKGNSEKTWDIENEIFKDKGPLFIVANQKTSYNTFDAGNWLWGYAIAKMGGAQSEATSWAKGYNRNDSQEDQNAIQSGFFFYLGFRDYRDCPKK